jgi:hypothetical protein
MTRSHLRLSFAVIGVLLAADASAQPVAPERIGRAAAEPHNWLTYSGTYLSQRYTTLKQITPQNVRNLEQQWVLQGQVLGAWQSSREPPRRRRPAHTKSAPALGMVTVGRPRCTAGAPP